MTLAWHTAYLYRVKVEDFPTLAAFVAPTLTEAQRDRQSRAESAAEARASFERVAAKFGKRTIFDVEAEQGGEAESA